MPASRISAISAAWSRRGSRSARPVPGCARLDVRRETGYLLGQAQAHSVLAVPCWRVLRLTAATQ